MSERSDYGIDDILDVDELEELGSPADTWKMPDAQVVEWENGVAVATPGFSIASSMDRFLAGGMTPGHAQTLNGFYSEFTDNNERVIFAGDELREILGEDVAVRIQGFNGGLAAKVRPPEEALEVIRRYDENYTGDVENDFWSKIESRNAVVPVVYSENGVIPETGMALMAGEGVLRSDDAGNVEDFMDKELESDTVTHDIQMNRYEAPDDADAEYFLDVMLPQGYDEVSYSEATDGVIINVDGDKRLQNVYSDLEVSEARENNGVLTLELS